MVFIEHSTNQQNRFNFHSFIHTHFEIRSWISVDESEYANKIDLLIDLYDAVLPQLYLVY